MKGHDRWDYAPYLPFDRRSERFDPYICRLAPSENALEAQWFSPESDSLSATVYYAVRGTEAWRSLSVSGDEFTISGLETDTDYALYLVDAAGRRSRTRLFRTGEVPGVVVNYLHPDDEYYAFSGRYLCSPCILKLESGRLLASMDVHAGARPQNLTLIFASDDGGAHWRYLTEIMPAFWGRMFQHRGRLFMLAISGEYGDVLLGESKDEGKTWCTPVVIARGASIPQENGFHRAPMPFIGHAGRLWSGIEYGSWTNRIHSDMLISIAADAEPMDVSNWVISEALRPDPAWPGAAFGIEGNAVVGPDGVLYDFLRYGENRALVLRKDVSDPDAALEFDHFAEFPLAHTKFELQKRGDVYYAVGNPVPARRVLSVFVSRDLVNWERVLDVIDYSHMDVKEVGFQYPAFTFDGDDLLILSRTACNRAHNFHDSNYSTFHRVTPKGLCPFGNPA